MKIIDFIEIGTSNFDTLLQSSVEETGLSIEPISYYLRCLPDKPGVTKVNCAVTNKRDSETISIYYIPEDTIEKNNLPKWFRGCNRVGELHPLHIRHGLQRFVVTEEVPLKNYNEIIEEYGIYKAKKIKIDTEGHDCVIMCSIYSFLSENEKPRYPEEIIFETNSNSRVDQVDCVLEKFKKIGYHVKSRGHDTILELR